VCDSFGKIISEASTEKEEIIVATVDLSHNRRIQEGWGFLRNRRPDTYKTLIKDNGKERKGE
jgi:agmatine deiminase